MVADCRSPIEMSPVSPIEMSLRQAVVETFGVTCPASETRLGGHDVLGHGFGTRQVTPARPSLALPSPRRPLVSPYVQPWIDSAHPRPLPSPPGLAPPGHGHSMDRSPAVLSVNLHLDSKIQRPLISSTATSTAFGLSGHLGLSSSVPVPDDAGQRGPLFNAPLKPLASSSSRRTAAGPGSGCGRCKRPD